MSRRVLLVGWDAADWKVIRPLMDAGRMPHVKRLVETGASGPIATLHPPLSPMLWTSIATGKRPFKHGILGFAEPTPEGAIRPITNLSRRTKAVWNILNQSGLRSIVVGWWPSHPAEPIGGVMVSDQFHRANSPFSPRWPLPPDSVHPARLADTIAGLRKHPDLLAPEAIEPFIPRAREVDQDRDRRLGLCMKTLAEFLSVESTAEWLIENEPWDFFAVYFDAIDHFGHLFMKYQPPRRPGVSARDFELYRNVISAAYRLHDEMLGRLLEKAGPETTVVLLSDHGFHPDHLRPKSIPAIPAGPAIEHRELGILLINGPGIRSGAPIHGASLLDVTPTVLALYGLPAGEDMDGRTLSQVFTVEPAAGSVPSWDEIPGDDGCHPPDARLDPLAAREALEQLIALGYIERPDEDRDIAAAKTTRELQYNLGEALQDAGRHAAAREIFRELRAEDPDEQRFAARLFASCQALRLHDEMRGIVDDVDGRRRALFEAAQSNLAAFGALERARARSANRTRESADARAPVFNEGERRDIARWRNLARFQPGAADYLKACLLTAEKRYSEALELLETLTPADLLRPAILLERAGLHLRMGRQDAARQLYEDALEIDTDNGEAHTGLCVIALRRREFEDAARAALNALDAGYNRPLAHYLLGRALEAMNQPERAAQAFAAAISLNPNFPRAHIRMAGLLEKRFGDAEGAGEHRLLARRMRNGSPHPAWPQTEAPQTETADRNGTHGSAIPLPRPTCSAPLRESLVVVTGLPRSGTSMLMQMLAAAGIPILSDDERLPDEDNPRGYFEFDPVRKMLNGAGWLANERGKAVKIVAPLLSALPAGLPCRVILIERDLDEVLDSQQRMLARGNRPAAMSPDRARILKAEYARTLDRAKAALALRPDTALLCLNHRDVLRDPPAAARKIAELLDGAPDAAAMANAIDPALYRNRKASERNAAGVSS